MPASDANRFPDVQIHESAYVDEPCRIGAGTKIWHFSHVMRDCVIGERCNLGQNVVVSPGVTLGCNVKVQNNVSIYTGVVLEDNVFCGPSMVFTNITTPRCEIVRRDEYVTTQVRRGASLGANCTVVCGVEIGRYALVAAGAVVTRDVPDHALIVGVPGRRRGWACRCGVVLPEAGAEGSNTLMCPDCGNVYREDEGALQVVNEVQDRERDRRPIA